MKHYILSLLCLPMMSCVMGPSVTEITTTDTSGVTKTTYHAGTGGAIAARRTGVMVDMVTSRGDQIRYTVEEEDSASLLETVANWWGINKGLKIAQPATLKGTEDVTATKLGAQQLEGQKAGFQHAEKMAEIAKETPLP